MKVTFDIEVPGEIRDADDHDKLDGSTAAVNLLAFVCLQLLVSTCVS